MSPERRVLVLGRHREGRPIEQLARDTAEQLRLAGWATTCEVVERKRDLRKRTARAVDDRVDLLVAVGGDGAVGQVATKLAGSGIPLGVVPAGTGNLFARNYGIPTEPSKAIGVVLEGHDRTIDVGMVEVGGKRRAFTIACGIGFDARVMDATSRDQKVRWGKLAYLTHALTQQGDLHDVRHTLELDGREVRLRAAQVFVANAGRMLPLLDPSPPVVPDDGLLDVIAVAADGPVSALRAAWAAVHQGGLGVSDNGRVFRARAREVRIETKRPRLVEIDGSVVGSTPVHASVVAGGLCIVVPA